MYTQSAMITSFSLTMSRTSTDISEAQRCVHFLHVVRIMSRTRLMGIVFWHYLKKKQSLTDCLHSGRSLWVLIAEGNVETPTFFLTDGRWRIYRISKRDLTACKIMKK